MTALTDGSPSFFPYSLLVSPHIIPDGPSYSTLSNFSMSESRSVLLSSHLPYSFFFFLCFHFGAHSADSFLRADFLLPVEPKTWTSLLSFSGSQHHVRHFFFRTSYCDSPPPSIALFPSVVTLRALRPFSPTFFFCMRS